MIIMNGTTVFGPNGAEFEIGDFLGSGGCGTVNMAKERGGTRTLAIKSLATPFADQLALGAFINEGNLAVGIRHPNVIEYVYFHDGTKHKDLPPYILMELADGGTLRHELERAIAANKRFTHDELLGMFRQMVAGMKAISEKLVHRDIKPENILISGGVLKISDFGLSKVVEEATRMTTFKGGGTFPYMAPEAWRLEKNTPQLDVYAMGVVFYELATLRLPIQPKSPHPQAWMDAHTYEAVPNPTKFNPDLSPKFSQIIVRMVEKSASKRFGSWDAIEKLLEVAGAPEGGAKNPAVAAMIKRRLEADTAEQAAKTEADRKAKEREDFCKLVLSQLSRLFSLLFNLW
jgi:eukaryotic-like serine/threonine-protein kinase